MRRILLIAAALVAGLLLLAVLLPLFLPSEAYRGQIETAASDALGRETSVSGDIRVSILPRIEVRAGDVAVADAEGFGDAPFAEMAALRLSVDLFPLLSGRISVRELILVDPVVRLTQRGAENNWTFATAETPAEPASGGFTRRPGALPIDAALGDVRLENGLILYSDGQTERRVEDLDLAVEMAGVDDPARIRGGFETEGERVTLDLRLDSLRGFLEGARTPVNAQFGGDLIDAEFDGAFLESPALDYEGTLELALPDLQRLSAVAGAPLPDGDIYRRFNASGDVSGSPARIAFENAEIGFDDITASGDFAAQLDGPRPRLTGRLSIPELDVTPYAVSGASEGGAPAQPSGGDWSEEPLDLSALRAADAHLTINAGLLRYGDIEVSDAALTARLENGRLVADLSRFNLYSGTGSARLVADARGAAPSYTLRAELDALNAMPFMQAAAGFDRLEGIGSLSLDLASGGASPAGVVGALSGQGRFDFADGAIRGVNLARVIRGVQAALESGRLPEGFGQNEATDFSSLAGTIDIADGVAVNPDFALLSPLLRVQGEGEVNLLDQSIDYRITPRAVADLTGQGGAVDLNGVAVPIRIRGSMTDPSISLDMERILRDLVRAQAGGLIGGQAGEALSEGRDIEDVLRDEAVNALFGALGRRDEPEEEEPPAETPPADDPPSP